MALSTFVGSLAQPGSTGNVAYTGVGFQPKAVIFFANQNTSDGNAANSTSYVGVGVSSSDRRATGGEYKDNVSTTVSANTNQNTKCIQVIDNAASVKSDADVVSLDSDGFTLNWTTADATARIINYMAIGGADLTNAASGSHKNAASGSESITGVGFKPDCVIFFMHQASTIDPQSSSGNISACVGFAVSSSQRGYSGTREKNGVLTDVNRRKQISTKAFASLSDAGVQDEFDLTSMDSDGFTINYSTSGLHYFYFLALKGGQYAVGVDTQKTSTGTKATTGLAFQPTGLLLTSIDEASSTTQDANARFALGAASSSTKRGCIWRGSTDAQVLSIASSNLDRANVIKMMTEAGANPTTQAAADFTSFDSGGFTLNWGTADGTAREFVYLAMGSNAVVAGGNDWPLFQQRGFRNWRFSG